MKSTCISSSSGRAKQAERRGKTKSKTESRTKRNDPLAIRRAVSAAALVLALLILFSAIAVCRVRIRRFSEEALRLIDAAFAAEEGSGEAYRAACGLERLLSENKNGLMLMISHRDIAQLVSRSREACALGENAGACDLAGPLSELRTMIELIAESNRLTLGNIL